MQITPANLNLFFTSLDSRFWQAYSVADAVYEKIATTYPVATEQWADAWIGMTEPYREWLGPRITKTPAPQTYIVPIQNFEKTVGIDQFKIEDDTYGVYSPLAAQFGEQAKKWPDYQGRDLLQALGSQTGSRQIGTDGLTHWNASHPVDPYDVAKGVYCNDFTGGGVTVNGTLVGGALALNAYASLWEEMASRKSDSGESLGLVPDTGMVPPQLKLPLDVILQAEFMGAPVIGTIGSGTGANAPNVGATSNLLKGWTDRLMWNDLSAAPTVWYLLVTKKAIKPFSWLMRKAPDMVIRNTPNDPMVVESHTYGMFSHARGAPAWALPFLSSRSGS